MKIPYHSQVKALFNPDYGMFTYDEATRLHWFRASHLNMETEFELVGVLIGVCACVRVYMCMCTCVCVS